MKKFSLAALILALSSSLTFAFSEKEILSPYAGRWNNLQPLVIDSSDGCELYYSISGTNPFESGFAYDGPVLIEKKGDVCVRIGCIEKSGLRKEFEINYTVTDPDLSVLDETGKNFAERILKSPLMSYQSGREINIPGGYHYSFENGRYPYLEESLSIKKENSFERFIPFVLTDGINTYHSVIHVIPGDQERVTKVKMPFEISDWTNFNFTDRNYIYQLDRELWNSDYEPRVIDRSVEHVVKFQLMNYKKGNGIYEVKIPPKPAFSKARKADGSVEINIKGDDNYSFANGKKSICLHVFKGEERDFAYEPEVFYDGNLQGTIKVPVVLDRHPPENPIIIPTRKASMSRSSVAFYITGDGNSDIFYSIGEPVFFEDDYKEAAFNKNKAPLEFNRYTGKEIAIRSSPDVAAVYTVHAYAVDRVGNRSRTVSQKFVLDELNYYVSSTSEADGESDGTFLHPFNSLSKAFEAINQDEKESRLYVDGKIYVRNEILKLNKDCRIYGKDCSIILSGTSSIEVSDCNLTLENCSVERILESGAAENPVLKFENSHVTINNCEISGSFAGSGCLLSALNSEVRIQDSGLTVNSGLYSLCSDLENTKVLYKGCRFTSTADTATNAKVSGRRCAFVDCSFTSIGNICRGVELFGTEAYFSNVNLKAVSENKSKSSTAVYADPDTVMKRFIKVRSKGF